MDFKRIEQTMTKEDFLESGLPIAIGCPNNYKLKSEAIWLGCKFNCKECWKKAIETNNVKFKDDKTEEQKVVEALKVVEDYCENKKCTECKFGEDKECACIICEGLSSFSPASWDIKLIEDMIKPKVTIYKVEHREGEQQYSFISDEKLSLWDMVVCDTNQGKSYGRIVGVREEIDNGYKKCWKVR